MSFIDLSASSNIILFEAASEWRNWRERSYFNLIDSLFCDENFINKLTLQTFEAHISSNPPVTMVTIESILGIWEGPLVEMI